MAFVQRSDRLPLGEFMDPPLPRESSSKKLSWCEKRCVYHNEPGSSSRLAMARLSIETEFVKTVKFDSVIQSFAKKKTRKAFVMVKS